MSHDEEAFLLDVVMVLDSMNFHGGVYFGSQFRDRYEAELPDSLMDTLKSTQFTSIHHDSKFTYFKIKGAYSFMNESFGLLYTDEKDFEDNRILNQKLIRGSSDGKGDWFFVETKI